MELQAIQHHIYEIRNQKVMLDFDLAKLYEVETKRLNEAVKRNILRFPERFMFQLTQKEWELMRSQNATASNQSKRNLSSLPYAFTEHGVTMLASVLKSQKAIDVNIAIIDAFIALKQYSLNYKDLAAAIKAIESKYNKQFEDVYEAINYLLKKDTQETHQKQRKQIGYNAG